MPNLTIHIGSISKKETPIELFPDPKKVFKKWDKKLAERILPVVWFDLTLIGKKKGKGCFLYYDDPAPTFLEWKTDGELITSVSKDVMELRPFEDAPDPVKLRKKPGAYLAIKTFKVKVQSEDDEWAHAQSAALKKLGVKGDRVRIGSQYPYYVQNTGMEGEETNLIDAELPGSALGLASMFFYLSVDGREFAQEMQMT